MDPAEQTRLRRERRQAKLKAEGSARLNRITSTQKSPDGSDINAKTPNLTINDDVPATAADVLSPSPSVSSTLESAKVDKHADDPPDIILSEHFYQPKPTPQRRQSPKGGAFGSGADLGPSEAELRQLMTQFPVMQDSSGQEGQPGPNDPMLALLQQMGLPAGGMGGIPIGGMQQPQQQERDEKWDPWWKLLHVLGALLLASFTLKETGIGSSFKGSVLERFTSEADKNQYNFFYYFATMELILQSSRFLIEKGRPPAGSILSTIGSNIPPPFGTYLITIARYSVILTTIVNDALLILFTVGMVSWWNT